MVVLLRLPIGRRRRVLLFSSVFHLLNAILLLLLLLLLLLRRLLIVRMRPLRRNAVRIVGPIRIRVDVDARVRVESHQLGLSSLERRAKRRVLDPELINDGTALLPPPVGLVRRRKRGIQELGARFKRLDMSKRRTKTMRHPWSIQIARHGLLLSPFAECALSLSVLFGSLALAQRPTS